MAYADAPRPNSFAGFDDDYLLSTGDAARADYVHAIADAINSISSSGRMVRTFWGGDYTVDVSPLRISVWDSRLASGRKLDLMALVVRRSVNPEADGQGLACSISDPTTEVLILQPEDTAHDLTGATTPRTNPAGVQPMNMHVGPTGTQAPTEVQLISSTNNAPCVIAGMWYEAPNSSVDPTAANVHITLDHFGSGLDIIGDSVTDGAPTIDQIRSVFLHLWNRHRPHFAWDAIAPIDLAEFTIA